MIITTTSEKETQRFGQGFVRHLKGGEVIGLIGELGSGKTTFVKGLAKGLGIKELITSPTFVLLKDYGKLVHIDLYRLKKPSEIKTLGLEDYLGRPDKICVIEWAERIKKYLPKKTKFIEFDFVNEKTRKIKYDFIY